MQIKICLHEYAVWSRLLQFPLPFRFWRYVVPMMLWFSTFYFQDSTDHQHSWSQTLCTPQHLSIAWSHQAKLGLCFGERQHVATTSCGIIAHRAPLNNVIAYLPCWVNWNAPCGDICTIYILKADRPFVQEDRSMHICIHAYTTNTLLLLLVLLPPLYIHYIGCNMNVIYLLFNMFFEN